MDNEVAARVPVHVWIVGALSLLWNGFGGYDYFMSRTHNDAYLKSMMPTVDPSAMWSYTDNMPLWAAMGWGLGVWMAVAGSVLLLIRSRHAVVAFGLSLIGSVVGLAYQLMSPPPGVEGAMATVIPIVIMAVAALLFLYARAQAAKGVLR